MISFPLVLCVLASSRLCVKVSIARREKRGPNNHHQAKAKTKGVKMSDKHHDVANILKLYELRREDGLRRARKWYFTEFNPQSVDDVVKIFVGGGHDGSAYYRMITSYWEMAASFVNNGGIDE